MSYYSDRHYSGCRNLTFEITYLWHSWLRGSHLLRSVPPPRNGVKQVAEYHITWCIKAKAMLKGTELNKVVEGKMGIYELT